MPAMPVSVIIPIAPDDDAWIGLVLELQLPKGSEVVLCVGEQSFDLVDRNFPADVHLIVCREGQGRAGQMNAGANMAVHDMLWFLHADSRINQKTLEELECAVSKRSEALYFFDLRFIDDGPSAMSWNEWAVQWRAGWMKIPFGDQGFLIPKSLFQDLGGYREDVRYGEDHVFVWKVRQEGYPVIRLPAPIFTSARKYQKGGWLTVTMTHIWLTIVQAVPNWLELKRRQLSRVFR